MILISQTIFAMIRMVEEPVTSEFDADLKKLLTSEFSSEREIRKKNHSRLYFLLIRKSTL